MDKEKMVKRLKRELERVAFASLIVDIAISAVTVASLKVGEAYTVPVLFIINYILTAIVVLSLILIALIALFSNHERIYGLFSFLRFWERY